jgi:hypothetical protein
MGGHVENQTGAGITKVLAENLKGKALDYVYLDEDDDGRYLGLVFTDGVTEYHLTFQEDGYVQLAAGPEDGDTVDEVLSFDLAELEEPFSDDGVGEV